VSGIDNRSSRQRRAFVPVKRNFWRESDGRRGGGGKSHKIVSLAREQSQRKGFVSRTPKKQPAVQYTKGRWEERSVSGQRANQPSPEEKGCRSNEKRKRNARNVRAGPLTNEAPRRVTRQGDSIRIGQGGGPLQAHANSPRRGNADGIKRGSLRRKRGELLTPPESDRQVDRARKMLL